MSNINEAIAEVLRLEAESTEPGAWDIIEEHTYYRTAAPALAREVQRLQAEVERLQAEIQPRIERSIAFQDAMEEAEAERDAALAVLRQVEWVGAPHGDRGTCPACGCIFWPDDIAHKGHASTCALAACLRAVEVE